MPKRGFSSIFKKEYQIVNLKDLNRIKESNIDPQLLKSKGLIKDKGKPVKILGDGDIDSPIIIQAHAFSKQAIQKIQKVGGKIETIHASIS
jgi:large subunit ribosomal protein L15